MTQAISEIAGLLKTVYKINPDHVIFLNQGYVNNCFLFTRGNEKMVLRIHRPDVAVKESQLEHEAVIYKFLSHKGYTHVPTLVDFDLDSRSSIISYIEGKEVDFKDLSVDQLEVVAKQIDEYHAYSYEDFVAFCEDNNYAFSSPTKPIDDFERFEKARYESIKNKVDEKWRQWLQSVLEEYKQMVLAHPTDTLRLIHGDIPGNTLKSTDNSFWFIDWEQGRYSYYEDIGCILGGATKIEDIDPAVLAVYCRYTNRTVEEVDFFLKYFVYTNFVGGTIWALDRYVSLYDTDFEQAKQFAEIAKKRSEQFDVENK